MFDMKGSLVPPAILGVAAVVLVVAICCMPNAFRSGIAIWAIVAILFGLYVLSGVAVSYRRRVGRDR